jgi:hemolysin activation/secretion protein
MIGGGAILPIDRQGTTLTGEFLSSRTQPQTAPGVPQNIGNFSRGLLRLGLAAVRTRSTTLGVTSGIEIITQSETLPQFATQASRDHYWAWRLGLDLQHNAGAIAVSVDATLSQGLAGRDGTTALPTSRQGASAGFTNFELSSHVTVPVPNGFAVDIAARGKTGFGKPMLLSEQFALDAANAVSSFAGGSFNVDTGATLREEFRYPPMTLLQSLTLAPYLFGAGGWGRIARPTAVEKAVVTAASAGLGCRTGLDATPLLRRTGATIGAEFGHQFSDVPGRKGGDRVNLSAAFQF